MSITQINEKLANGAIVKICPWTMAFSNQALVQVESVAGNRTVTYTWDGEEEGSKIVKTSQVSYSTWNYIVAALSN